MKTIQIRYLGPTDTKPSRLKAWSHSGVKIEEVLNYEKDIDVQARELAGFYAMEEWGIKIVGFGTLPNGDFVATLEG